MQKQAIFEKLQPGLDKVEVSRHKDMTFYRRWRLVDMAIKEDSAENRTNRKQRGEPFSHGVLMPTLVRFCNRCYVAYFSDIVHCIKCGERLSVNPKPQYD